MLHLTEIVRPLFDAIDIIIREERKLFSGHANYIIPSSTSNRLSGASTHPVYSADTRSTVLGVFSTSSATISGYQTSKDCERNHV